MAARIALSRANLRDEAGALVYDAVSVIGTNDNQVQVRKGSTPVLTLTSASVERYTANSWRITDLTTETVYLVEIVRGSGCGCGR